MFWKKYYISEKIGRVYYKNDYFNLNFNKKVTKA